LDRVRTDLHNPAASQSQASREASLQSATDDLQRELEQLVATFDLSDPAQYRRFLQASAASLLALETLLESSGVENLLRDWPARTRRNAIDSDLRRLELEPRPMELRRKSPTGAEMFGMIYALEITRLAAPELLQRLAANADTVAQEASAYLQAHDVSLWGGFVTELETDPATADQAQVVAGAIYAFTIFIRSFEHAP
jgi:heme oxygenase